MTIQAHNMHFSELCQQVRAAEEDVVIQNCLGQRYIGSGVKNKNIEIFGIPGNALGAYFGGDRIVVHGNVQDATGDTMDGGTIVVHGSSGDATGYAMRGGSILIRDNAGYRAGIHMKEYAQKRPTIVIGGRAGSFLGEYQAGGIIVVLGLNNDGAPLVGHFCGTGMHGGRIFLRTKTPPEALPKQVLCQEADSEDMDTLAPLVASYSETFGTIASELLSDRFYVLKPDSKNPYRQLYVNS